MNAMRIEFKAMISTIEQAILVGWESPGPYRVEERMENRCRATNNG